MVVVEAMFSVQRYELVFVGCEGARNGRAEEVGGMMIHSRHKNRWGKDWFCCSGVRGKVRGSRGATQH